MKKMREGRSLTEQIKESARRDPARAYRAVGFHGDLRNGGRRKLVGRCPLHTDRNPSFKITTSGPHAGTWKCFGCGAGGSVIDFYLRLHDLAALTPSVLEDLCRLLGVESGDGDQPQRGRARAAAAASSIVRNRNRLAASVLADQEADFDDIARMATEQMERNLRSRHSA